MRDLKEVLEQNKEKYIEELKNLVGIDTHDLGHGIDGGLEKQGQEYMVNLFESMGADEITVDPMDEAVIQESYKKHQEGNLGHNQTDRANVYATFKGKQGGKSLLFNGHIDVMPAEMEDGWTNPPFEPVIRDGKMYGRGCTDMKGGLMASVMAVKLLQDAGYELPGDVTITSVCDEEGGGNGSIQAVMRGLKADGVVNCEPTDDTLILAHMGWVFFKVDFEGKACHSGAKAEGVSAIEKAIKVIQGLNEMEHRWLLTIRHRLLPPPSLNIGVIEGGTAGSTVPGECSFSTCVHYVPTLMNQDMVVKEFTEVVERISRSDAWMEAHPPKISIYQTGHGFEMEEDHPLVDTFKEAYSEALSRSVKVEGSHFGCDSRLWRNIAGCPTIQYGPGEGAQCHTVDEWLKLDSYLEVLEIVLLDPDGNPILPSNADDYPEAFDEQELFPADTTYEYQSMFDEVYHARTANEIVEGRTIYETTHPPLGKWWMSLGIRVFGMTPFGWRCVCALFGILMVPVSYAFMRKISRSTWIASFAALLIVFDFMHFTLSRIGTIDVIVGFFILLTFYLMYLVWMT